MPNVIRADERGYYLDNDAFIPNVAMSPETRNLYDQKLAAYTSANAPVQKPESFGMTPAVQPQSLGMTPAVAPSPIPLAPPPATLAQEPLATAAEYVSPALPPVAAPRSFQK